MRFGIEISVGLSSGGAKMHASVNKTRTDVQCRPILVVLRYDDYSQVSPTDFERDVIGALREHRASCTFGVIPCVATGDHHDVASCPTLPLDACKTDILVEAADAGVVEVALHGYSHQTIRSGDDCTEFEGLDPAGQSEKISNGAKCLAEVMGSRVTTFIPPWNSYDRNTLAVLAEQGFELISADTRGVAAQSSALKFLPCTCGLSAVEDVVISARRIPDLPSVIVALFHAYDFREIDPQRGTLTWDRFPALLKWLAAQDDVRVVSLTQAAETVDDLSSHRYQTRPGRAPYLLPLCLRKAVVAGGTYPATGATARLWRWIACFYLLLVSLSAASAFVAGRSLFPMLTPVAPVLQYGSVGLLAFLLVHALHDRRPTSRGAMAIAVCLGLCMGIWTSILAL